jgi:Ribbon-Helix-Helix transcriptional regulator family
VVSKTLVLGLQHNTRRDLEAVHVAGETPQIKVLGLVTVANDVSPEIALASADSRRSRQW